MTERWLVATTEYAGVTSYTGGIGRHYAALLPALAAQGAEIDLVVFTDGPVGVRATPGIRRLVVHRPAVVVQSRLEARQVRRSVGIVAISHAMADRAERIWGRMPRVEVVRNCIDVATVRYAAATRRPPAGWPGPDGPIVFFLGRAERRKGVVDGVDAFARVAQRHPTARLVLAGAGGDDRFEPSRAALLDRVPSAARDRVTFLGHVSGDELYGAIAAADVVMCPSRWEGFGNVAVEVMAAGAPLVVTSGSGFDDFCTDGADCLMVPPADPEALAAALATVLDDPGAARRRATRAAAGVDRFAPAPVAADLRAAVDRMLSRAAIPA